MFNTRILGLCLITGLIFAISGCNSSKNEGANTNPPGAAGPGPGGGALPVDSVVLTWDGPTSNAVSTISLTDLAGYRVYRSTTSGQYNSGDRVADIPANSTGGGSETFQIDNLASGAHYFVVTAYDNAVPANESVFSSEVSKLIP